jgi:hypothetical protein
MVIRAGSRHAGSPSGTSQNNNRQHWIGYHFGDVENASTSISEPYRCLKLTLWWALLPPCFIFLSMPRISVAFLQKPTQHDRSQSCGRWKCRSAHNRNRDYTSPLSTTATSRNETHPPLLNLPPEVTLKEYFWTSVQGESDRYLFPPGTTDDTGNSTANRPAEALLNTLTMQNDLYHSDHEAIQRVSGIIDMFHSEGVIAENEVVRCDVGPKASCSLPEQNVVAKSVEGICRRLYLRSRRGIVIRSEILEELESLLCKSSDLGIAPTQTSLETLWSMQQDNFESCQQTRDEYSSLGKISRRHVGRSVKLLTHWSSLATNDHSTIRPPPSEYIEATFCLARDIRMSMTYSLWSLYENHVVSRRKDFSREVFTAVLGILAVSPLSSWKVREISVLQLLDEMGEPSRNNDTLTPSVEELESALETAAATGSSQQATWLFQSLQDRITDQDDDFSSRHLDLWFQALCNDTSEGSVLYLEYLLFPKSVSNFPLTTTVLSKRLQHRDFYNLYLQKLATCGAPDAGMRAESVYLKMEKLHRETRDENVRPNHDTLHSVVMAHMKADTPTDVQLAQVQRFLQSRNSFSGDRQL